MDRTWDGVRKLRGRLDEEDQAAAGDVRLLRVLKVGEEFGEAAEAITGALGANPRKGNSHTWEDVEKELCDVIVTAQVALGAHTQLLGLLPGLLADGHAAASSHQSVP